MKQKKNMKKKNKNYQKKLKKMAKILNCSMNWDIIISKN